MYTKKLNPSRRLKVPRAIKGERREVTITHNPSTIDAGHTLNIKFPGKKLAEHNKKMKQQLVKMKLADEPSEESSFTQTAFENRSLILGGLGIAGVVVLYLIWKNKSTSSRQVSAQPKQSSNIPKQEPILDME